MKRCRVIPIVLPLLVVGFSSGLWANDQVSKELKGRIPDEYESDGGHSLGFGMGGTAASTDLGAVRSNPAMMVFDKNYQVSAGYHWPSLGRDFYQAGVVDSKTSSVAAGVTYSSALSDYKTDPGLIKEEEQLDHYYDARIKNRISIGLAQPFGVLAAGIGAQIITGIDKEDKIKGTTLGIGVAGLLSQTVRFGVSAENLANKDVKNYAPRAVRVALAYTLFGGDVTAHLDYKQRERVQQELFPYSQESASQQVPLDIGDQEKMLIGSFSVRIQDLLRVLGAYGQDLAASDRKSLSGGVVLINKGFSLSYLLSKPYLNDSHVHQAVNLSMQLSM